MNQAQENDLVRNILVIALIGALLAASFWILRPFLPALIWASMIVIATWPLLLMIEDKVRSRRAAVIVITGLLVLVFVIPFSLAVGTIVENAPQIGALGKQLATFEIPPPPDWVERIPLVGDQAEVSRCVASALQLPATPEQQRALRQLGGGQLVKGQRLLGDHLGGDEDGAHHRQQHDRAGRSD